MKMLKLAAVAVFSLISTTNIIAEDTAQMTKLNADLIVSGAYIVTMNEAKDVLQDGALVVKDGVIIALGKRADITAKYTAAEVISGEGRAIMPGFVNGHTHAAMVLFRGMADDLPLMTWLQKYIFPMEGAYVDEALIKAGTALACYEMIESGTTSFVDMYFYPDAIAGVVEKCGLRATISTPMIDYPSPGFKGWDDSFAAGVDFAKRWKGKHPRITPALAPHAPYTVSPEHLAQAFAAAKDLDVPVSIHVAEDRAEIKTIKDQYGVTPIEHLAKAGMLEQTTIAAHMVWPSTSDIEKLAGSKVGVIHNPTSNMKTGAGVAPIPAMLKAGVKVGIGTDGAASNNDLDMWPEMRFAALIHKGVSNDPTVIPAIQALNMATKGGAEAAGFPTDIGSLEVGMKADFIQISLDKPRLTPLYDIVSHLVYAANSSDVVTSVVDGKILMKDRKVLTLDKAEVMAAVEVIAEKIRKDLAKE
jgi:5-methylthioadenosine/S-adenosylhomocysteine deaminase